MNNSANGRQRLLYGRKQGCSRLLGVTAQDFSDEVRSLHLLWIGRKMYCTTT